MYGFKYCIKGKIIEVCKNVENVKGLTSGFQCQQNYQIYILLINTTLCMVSNIWSL